MTTYGVTDAGFVIPTAAEILADVETDQRASPALGAAIDLSPEQALGQINVTIATRLRTAWEGILAAFQSRDPSTFGAALERLSAITGTARSAGVKSAVKLRVTLAAGTTLAIGAVASVPGQPTSRWVTTQLAVNAGGSPADVYVDATSETVGAWPAAANTITVIATPTSGWTAVTNPAAAVPGRAKDSDPQLRQRRVDELHSSGSSPVDAMRLALSRVTGVVQALVIENTSDAPDPAGNILVGGTFVGRPPHSVEAIVLGGDDAAVAAAVWASKGGGIGTWGTSTANVVDVSGVTREVRFTRPTDRTAYASLRVVTDPARYAGDAAVADAVESYAASLGSGQPLQLSALPGVARAVRGVLNVLLGSIELGWSVPTLSQQDLTPTVRERVALPAANVTVLS